MNNPFEPVTIGGISFKNRIIRSPTHEGLADDRGFPTKALAHMYSRLAKGGIGGIITGYSITQPDGKSPLYRGLMIDNDEAIPLYRELTRAAHDEGVPILLQVAHCGRQTRSASIGFKPVAPSALRDKFYNEEIPHELTHDEIEAIIKNFVEAARRGKEAGFDGVQFHAAHGYLLSEFLSPYMNRRRDAWGATTENRARILTEIISRAKRKLGTFPLWVKMNGHDGRKGGMTVPEAAAIARLLEQSGCDGIEISCGVMEDNFYSTRFEVHPAKAIVFYNFKSEKIPPAFKPLLELFLKTMLRPRKPIRLFNLPAAREIKKAVTIPVMAVGGVRTLNDVKEVVADGGVDLVSLSKPLLLEPDLVAKFMSGKQDKAKCIDCCYCMLAAERGPTRCCYGKIPAKK
jgi:2,4-dienoyl-CoA reductase-like NADH-dependent reductase (Old Yellow Enzyme family)